MSGSPIIQDGKLIGAVTHVMINDPSVGYGTFIENMPEQAQNNLIPEYSSGIFQLSKKLLQNRHFKSNFLDKSRHAC